MEGRIKPRMRPKGIASTFETMSDETVGLAKVGEVRTLMVR
jgi:hypothetical protein